MFARLHKWLSAIGIGLKLVAAAIGIAAVYAIARMTRTRLSEQEAADAEDEARRVKEAGERGSADEVLDSLDRATRRRKR